MSGQHFLIVHEVPEDGMEVEHPDECPTGSEYDGMVVFRTCDVGVLEHFTGVEEYFRRTTESARTHDDREPVTVGRHPIEAWSQRIDFPYSSTEYDSGLCLTHGSEP